MGGHREVQQKAAAPEMKELIDATVLNHRTSGIKVNPPATPNQIAILEKANMQTMWGMRLAAEGQYEIFNGSYPELAPTSS